MTMRRELRGKYAERSGSRRQLSGLPPMMPSWVCSWRPRFWLQHERSFTPQHESHPGTVVPAPQSIVAVTALENLGARPARSPPRLKPWTATPARQLAPARRQTIASGVGRCVVSALGS